MQLKEILLRMKQVIVMTGLSRSAIYKKIKEGEFPKGSLIGKRSRRWKLSEIQDWISSVTSG